MPTSPEVRQRLRDEGVPERFVCVVAAELHRCVELRRGPAGGRGMSIAIHPWTAEMLARLEDKVKTLFMTLRGRVNR